MKIKQIKKYIALVLFVCILIPVKTVYAREGSITFGSESYRWYTDKVCPIGVYVNGEVPVGEYEVWLEYDEELLFYLNGATSQEGNRLCIKGTGTDITNKIMLHFQPLKAGSTSIKVISAQCRSIGDVTGNILPEDLDITELLVAPITIFESGSSELQRIEIDGTEVEDFARDVYEYSVEVDEDIENIELSYIPVDLNAVVSVSDTSLQMGTNEVTVTVEATTGETSIYTLHVDRRTLINEPEETATPENEIADVQQEVEEPLPEETDLPLEEPVSEEGTEESFVVKIKELWDKALNFSTERDFVFLGKSPLLWLMTFLVFVFMIAYFVRFIKYRKNERAQLREQQIEEKQDDDFEIINLEQEIIKVKNVTMRFRLAQEESSSLKEYMIRTVKGQNHYHYLTALDNVSFSVSQGDVVGIIGTNGSGKSTLLKIVSGALQPTEGHVEVDRSKVQMLTLGTGFDMELTAKENVYLNGAIIGYTREYIDEKYDDIVAFAELEGFMDERMKNFSSGMVSRLGFAIATMRDTPDILILDEVLSVGDMFFREKSMQRIREMIHGGSTVLIVSHSPDVIVKNCNVAVWIEKGVLQMVGDPKKVCDAYKNYEVTGKK